MRTQCRLPQALPMDASCFGAGAGGAGAHEEGGGGCGKVCGVQGNPLGCCAAVCGCQIPTLCCKGSLHVLSDQFVAIWGCYFICVDAIALLCRALAAEQAEPVAAAAPGQNAHGVAVAAAARGSS